MADVVWLNGKLLPRYRARVSVYDHGFLYGYGLFETMRAYGGRIFRLQSHLDRLASSAAKLNMTLPGFDMAKACYAALRANNLSEGRIRLTVTPGPGELSPDIATCRGGTAVVGVRPVTMPSDDKYEQGYWAALSSYQRHSKSPLAQVKSTCYVESVLARREARRIGVDEVIMLNESGQVAEGSITNVFLVKNGTVATPALSGGVLPGITRQIALDLSKSMGMKSEERAVAPAELGAADEAFLTNSVLEIMPLTLFAGKPIGSGEAGPVARRLRAAYLELTCAESENKEACLL